MRLPRDVGADLTYCIHAGCTALMATAIGGPWRLYDSYVIYVLFLCDTRVDVSDRADGGDRTVLMMAVWEWALQSHAAPARYCCTSICRCVWTGRKACSITHTHTSDTEQQLSPLLTMMLHRLHSENSVSTWQACRRMFI